jgi:TrmH family RNA methyltransferase
VHRVTDAVLAAMSDAQTPQGLVAVCRVPTVAIEVLLARRPRLVCVLAEVRDPGNAGTVLRGADAAGADLVVVAGDSVDVYSPKVVRSSAGSIFHVPVVTAGSVEATIAALREAGLAVLAADARASVTLDGADLQRRHAWVLGNEARGLPADVVGLCDESVRVPIHGRAESLNLAMAAVLCLYASAAAQRGGAG